MSLASLEARAASPASKGQVVDVPGRRRSTPGPRSSSRSALAVPSPTAEQLRRAAGTGVARGRARHREVRGARLHRRRRRGAAIAEGVALGAYEFDAYKTPSAARPRTSKTDVELTSAVVLSPFARQTPPTRAVERAAAVAEAVNARPRLGQHPARRPAPAGVRRRHRRRRPATPARRSTIWTEALARGAAAAASSPSAPGSEPRRGWSASPTAARGANAAPRARRQGHHVRLRRPLASSRRRHADDEVRHGRRGRGRRGDGRDRRARACRSTVTAFACIAENMPSGSRHPPGRRAHDAQRRDRRGPQHRRRGPPRARPTGSPSPCEDKPDAIVDVATLTGACIVALGERTAGVMGNDDASATASSPRRRRAGEPMWPLPIPEEMKREGHVVQGRRPAAAQPASPPAAPCSPAAFLREFVAEDCRGRTSTSPARRSTTTARGYTPEGGTGFGVRTLVQIATELAALTPLARSHVRRRPRPRPRRCGRRRGGQDGLGPGRRQMPRSSSSSGSLVAGRRRRWPRVAMAARSRDERRSAPTHAPGPLELRTA